MSALRQALTEYLAMRRALGYKLDKTERLLCQFVSFVEDRGEECLTTETALAWELSQYKGLTSIARTALGTRGAEPACPPIP